MLSGEQLFWMICIVLLNIAAYLVGRHEGTRYGRENTIEVFKLVAPDEMKLIEKRFDEIDPIKFVVERMKEESK